MVLEGSNDRYGKLDESGGVRCCKVAMAGMASSCGNGMSLGMCGAGS